MDTASIGTLFCHCGWWIRKTDIRVYHFASPVPTTTTPMNEREREVIVLTSDTYIAPSARSRILSTLSAPSLFFFRSLAWRRIESVAAFQAGDPAALSPNLRLDALALDRHCSQVARSTTTLHHAQLRGPVPRPELNNPSAIDSNLNISVFLSAQSKVPNRGAKTFAQISLNFQPSNL